MFESPEPVTIFNQFTFFFLCQSKHEIRRESPLVPFDGLIQC
jgi:hypothetical protein